MSGLDAVIFENLKLSYVINEDIMVVYAVNRKVRTSSRDWIGLFTQGWTEPEEQIVFEWTTGRPSEEILPRRTVTFCSKDFSSRIQLDQRYQFAYISRAYEVLGRSEFFSFVAYVTHHDHEALSEKACNSASDSEDNEWLLPTQACSQSTNRVKALPVVVNTLTHPALPPNYTRDPLAGEKHSTCRCSSDNVTTYRHLVDKINSNTTNSTRIASSVVETLPHPDLPPNYSHGKAVGKKCPSCSCPSDYMILNNCLTEKVVSQAEQIRSLQSKLTALRNELELCQVSQQQLKVKADMACREKENYSSFIGQFLESLKRKGQLKVVDTEGNAIMVKNVSPQVSQTNTKKHSSLASGVPKCHHVNLNLRSDLQQRLRQDLARELRQVCRQYCEETESVQAGGTDVSLEDNAGQFPLSAAMSATSAEFSQDVPVHLKHTDTNGEQLINDKDLVNNETTVHEDSRQLQDLFRHRSMSQKLYELH